MNIPPDQRPLLPFYALGLSGTFLIALAFGFLTLTPPNYLSGALAGIPGVSLLLAEAFMLYRHWNRPR